MNCILIIIAIVAVIFIIIYKNNKKEAREQLAQRIKYIESLNLSDTLSRYIKTYMETGNVPNDYFYIEDLNLKGYISLDKLAPIDINEAVKDLEKFVLYYKNKLLENFNNGTDYKTKYGIVREIYLGKIEEIKFLPPQAEITDDSLHINKDSISVGPGQKCNYIGLLSNCGFIVNRDNYGERIESRAGYYEKYLSYVYAYIKL